MQRHLVRNHGALDSLPNPRPAQPYSVVRRRRHMPEWYQEPKLRGKDFWKAMGMAAASTALLFFVWWFGGK